MLSSNPISMTGELILILGCMWSGKTTKLLQYYNKYKLKYSCLLINHSNDNRYKTNYITTHDSFSKKAISIKNIDDLDKNLYKNAKVILIDESQFFDKNIIKFVKNAINLDNKIIIMAGLNSDFQKKKIGYINDLLVEADKIEYQNAICHFCKTPKDAIFSLRINKNNKKQILVGSNKNYVAVCRYHYKINNI